MREHHKRYTSSMPTLMELQMMLKKLKLSQIKDEIQTKREFQLESSCNQLIQKQPNAIAKQDSSIIYDNFQDPNCFEEQIKAIDTIQLNRIIEKKFMTKQTNQPHAIVQKFRFYLSEQNNKEHLNDLNKSRCKAKQINNDPMSFEAIQKPLNKSASILAINRQIQNSKQNKKPKVNRQNKANTQTSQKGKNKVLSKIPMHKFSDCQSLLRFIHKKW